MNNLVTIENDKPVLKTDMVLKIIDIEDKLKQLKEIQDEYKKEILTAMEENGIIKLSDETTGLTINYIEAKTNIEKFDQAKFKKENPDLYDEYVTLDGKKSAYITIKLK